jgi:glycosyltransferase involved in cell wall biosynthesis
MTAKEAKNKPKSVVWQSYYLSNVGFGEAARNYTLALYKAGNYKIKVFPYEGLAGQNIGLEKFPEGRTMLGFLDTEITERPIWVTEMGPLQIHPTMGYSVGLVVWECYEWSKQFINNLKKQDEIWVPAKFNRDALVKGGLKNVHLMPHAIDTDRFNPEKVVPQKTMFGDDKFKFLSIMGWSERKGVSDLLEAYQKEFRKEDNTILYIKLNFVDVQKAQRRVAAIRRMNNKGIHNPLIALDPIVYSFEDFPALYKMADAFVLPSRGEGWGLNFTEAMSMELPTIGTAACSMTDFMTHENSYPVKIKGFAIERMCDHICGDYIGKKFPVIDVDDLRRQMRMVWGDRETAKRKGQKARQDIIQNYSFPVIGKRIDDRCKDIWSKMSHFTVPKEVIVGQRDRAKTTEKWNLREWMLRNLLKIGWANLWHKSKKWFYKWLTILYKNIYEKKNIKDKP